MNLINKTNLSTQQTTYWEEQAFEKEFNSFDQLLERNEKVKIHIKFTSDQKIIYSQNGVVLRVIEGPDVFYKPITFNNMDQIKNLSWQGQYDQKKMKNGNWIAFWNNALLKNVGGYYKEGQKLGLWKDLFLNYSNEDKLYEIGEYYNDQKIGKWYYLFNGELIHGGFYNKNGQKQGKWVEVDEEFFVLKKVTYVGEYNMNNMKVGRWDIMYDRYGYGQYKQIGGGSYDQDGNQKKIGKWVELDEKFNYNYQVTYNGEYNMNNMKVGRWYIMYCNIVGDGQYKQINISKSTIINQYSGGGSYDQEGNQKKIGKWVELDEKFGEDKQVTYNGEYKMNNMKVGRWDIMYCERYGDGKYKQIGGGSYDQEGNQKKIGKWVELDEGFNDGMFTSKQVTFNGEYNIQGQKVGLWVEMDIRQKKKYDN